MDGNITNYGSSTSGTFGTAGTTGGVSSTLATDTTLGSGWTKSSVSASTTRHTGPTGYNSNPSNPALPPAVADPGAAYAAYQHIFDFTKTASNLVSSGLLQTSDPSKDEEVTDPEILALAEKEGESAGQVYQGVQVQALSNFKSLLRQLPASLFAKYPNAARMLLFAYNNPGQAANLPADLQAQLQTMQNSVTQSLIQQYGFSSSWQGIPPNSDEFNQSLSQEYDANFESNLQQAAKTNNLSTSDVALLRTMHYLPNSAAGTTDPNLLSIFNTAQSDALAAIEQEYDVNTATYTISPESARYTQTLTGAYQNALFKAMQSTQPPLTQSQQQQIQQYLQNPSASVDPNIAQLAQSLKASAMAAVIAQFGLQSNWQPTISSPVTPGTDPATSSLVQQGLGTAHELLNQAYTLVAKLPDGPQKNAYINFLQALGMALLKAENEIYAIMGAQDDASRKLNIVRLQAQQDDLNQQKKASDNISDKQKKMVQTGPMNQIMGWVFKVVMLIAAVALLAVNPVLGAIAIAATIFSMVDEAVSEATGKPSLTKQLFQDVTNALGNAGGAAMNLILSVVLSGGNPLLFMDMVFSQANVIGGFVAACGGTQEQQMIATAVIQGIIMIAAMIVLTVVTLGAGSEGLVAGVMDTIANVLNVSDKTVKVADIVFTCVQVGLSCTQVISGGFEVNNDVLLSEIDMIKGRSDAQDEQIQAIIAILQMLIKKLLDMLKGESDNIVTIDTMQGKKWTDASDISTQITSAIPT